MVTGIETAGLILAIFPLAISALEHYREGLEPLKDWKRFRTEFLATVDAAGLQLTIFEDNLEELLAPHIDSDVELRALLDDRRGILWKAPELESRLRDRLPKSYDFLCATIGRLYEILIKLLHKLGIDDGQPRWILAPVGTWSARDELRRIRFSLSHKSYTRLLDSIAKLNNDIATVRSASERLAPLRKQRRWKASTSLDAVRLHASKLHSLFSRSWKCACSSPHDVNLVLEQRPKASQVKLGHAAPYETSDVSFGVNFYVKPLAASTVPSLLQTTILVICPDNFSPPTLSSGKKRTVDTLGELSQNMRSQLRIGQVTAPSSGKHIQFISKTDPPPQPNPAIAEISDLCATINNTALQVKDLGSLSEGNTTFLIRAASANGGVPRFPNVITLGQLLSNGVLSRKDRLNLAMILSSSLLQLHSTPWLNSAWSSNDILFNLENKLPIVSHPFVARHFTVGQSFLQVGPSTDSRESLLRLGIVLLELLFNALLEKQPFYKECFGPKGQPNEYTDRTAAMRWEQFAVGEGGEDYANVVRQCLGCCFGPASTDLTNAELCQAVHEAVVEPLQSIVATFSGSHVP